MILKDIWLDIKAVQERDPAARSALEVLLLYQGIHALIWHRFAHWFYKHKMFFIARLISQIARFFTLIEIHPGAQLGHGILIDHGSGVVIGETAVVGDNCTIYQNVTLGGTGKHTGKRHPTLGDNVMVGSGAKVLGPFTVGSGARVAAGAVVLDAVPENATAVGVPARVVRVNGMKVSDSEELDQIHVSDPVSQELCRMNLKYTQMKRQMVEMQLQLEAMQKKLEEMKALPATSDSEEA